MHHQLIATGAIDVDTVREIRRRGQALAVGVGTVLRVSEPTGARTPMAERLHRSQRATVTATAGSRLHLLLDDGTARAVTPAALLKHFTYGYAGTVHKVQGQTSAVHVSAMSPVKDAASLYVSASRARLGVFFVADATEFLSDAEVHHTRTWGKAQFDDAVIDRIEATLLGRTESVDSAAASMLPKPAPTPAYSPHAYGPAGYSAPRSQGTGDVVVIASTPRPQRRMRSPPCATCEAPRPERGSPGRSPNPGLRHGGPPVSIPRRRPQPAPLLAFIHRSARSVAAAENPMLGCPSGRNHR